MPVVVIPLISSAVVGFLMFLVIGKPIASLQRALTDWLNGLSGANAIILGVILGLMMCFDLGGPLNKVAYAFAVGGLANPTERLAMKVMAAVMAAGMVPPLAMALATTVRGRLFTKTERENGKAAWVLGASFITEGAIPFAAADPLRVIPVLDGGRRGHRRPVDGLRLHPARPARRHLRGPADRQPVPLPHRHRRRCLCVDGLWSSS